MVDLFHMVSFAEIQMIYNILFIKSQDVKDATRNINHFQDGNKLLEMYHLQK
jgi:hypothetical protein